jgi:hypothetical protein
VRVGQCRLGVSAANEVPITRSNVAARELCLIRGSAAGADEMLEPLVVGIGFAPRGSDMRCEKRASPALADVTRPRISRAAACGRCMMCPELVYRAPRP